MGDTVGEAMLEQEIAGRACVQWVTRGGSREPTRPVGAKRGEGS